MRRVVFHIGLAKTGTTAFQVFCHRHRRFLQRQGVLYPQCQVGRGRNHSPFVASYIAHRPEGPTVALRWKSRGDAVRAMRAEIDASEAEIALLSSEHFSMHFDRSEALELAQDFSAYDCSVIIALRDPHARFLSAYNTHVTAGGYLSIEEHARTTLIPGTRYMSAREVILIWQEAFGHDRIRLIDYDAISDVSGAILHHCGIGAALPSAARARRRVSLGLNAITTLRGANEIIAGRQAGSPEESIAAWAQLSFFSILCRRKLARSPSGGTWTLSAATMQALDEIADADRRWVMETYGLHLQGDGTRDRISIDTPSASDTAAMLQARTVVDRATRGLWAPSQFLVAALDRIVIKRAKN